MRLRQEGSVRCAVEATDLSALLGGRKVLEVPSLRVNSGEVLMIIGPNGSGKTTLLLCLALLLKPAGGTVAYGGVPISGSRQVLELHRRIGVVLQEPLLLNSSVWDNVTLGLRLRGVARDETGRRAEKWLERFGIRSLAKREARTLSGGEAKRVSLARAFVLQPEVLFLDEPFTALDTPTRQSLLEDFEGVLTETRVTTVMVTHDRDEALALGDRVAVLMGGSIRQIGTPEELYASPSDEEVAYFIGAGNVLHGTVDSQESGLVSVNVSGKRLQAVSVLPAGSQVTAYLRYEDVTISLPVPGVLSSARNQLNGKVVRVFPFGSQLKVTVDCGFPISSVITRRSGEDLGLEEGRGVVASFKASSVHLIHRRLQRALDQT